MDLKTLLLQCQSKCNVHVKCLPGDISKDMIYLFMIEMIYPSPLTASEMKQSLISRLGLLLTVKGNSTKEKQMSACLSSYFLLLDQMHALYLTPLCNTTNLCSHYLKCTMNSSIINYLKD